MEESLAVIHSRLTSEASPNPIVVKKRAQANINDLPLETLMYIFSFLGSLDLGKVSLVSRQWKTVSSDEFLWKRFIRELPANFQELPGKILCEKFMGCQKKWKAQIEAAMKISQGIQLPRSLIDLQPTNIEKPVYEDTTFSAELVLLLKNSSITLKERIEALEEWLNGQYPFISKLFKWKNIALKEDIEMVLKAGANPNLKPQFAQLERLALPQFLQLERLPLYCAVDDANYEVIELLLKYDANINPYFDIPFECAVSNGDIKMLDWLIEHGAKPYSDTLQYSFWNAVEREDIEMVKWLHAYGVKPDSDTLNWAYNQAVKYHNDELTALLIKDYGVILEDQEFLLSEM